VVGAADPKRLLIGRESTAFHDGLEDPKQADVDVANGEVLSSHDAFSLANRLLSQAISEGSFIQL
jgi:hypothetical protein